MAMRKQRCGIIRLTLQVLLLRDCALGLLGDLWPGSMPCTNLAGHIMEPETDAGWGIFENPEAYECS